jgi:transposase InsO family protein
MRWNLKLAEFDFSIEHRAGKKMPHVDALSRHVGAVLQGRLDPETVGQEQGEDKFCRSLTPGTHSSESEFFIDKKGLLYRRGTQERHQLVVPKPLVGEVIKLHHDPVYASHPGVKRTHDLIALNFWWPGMRVVVKEYVRACHACQRAKEGREFKAPLGEAEEPTAPFQITAMDLTGPYPLTPRKNRYLLTLIDHFSKYVEAFPIPDQSAETCAMVHATQIVARQGSGSKLITDQGNYFMSNFFNTTCKVLSISRSRTTPFNPSSNGNIERWRRSLHTGLSHYINAAHTNWDEVVPFFLMAYRATPNTTTEYSPFFLVRGREMTLPSNENLGAKLDKADPSLRPRMANLRASLKLA